MLNVHWKELGGYYPFVGQLVTEFMTEHDTASLPCGRYELRDGCAAILSEYDTAENRRFEAHRRMADVQLLLSGRERILCAPLCDGTADGEWNDQKDVGFYTVTEQPHDAVLTDGSAVLLLPWDMHAPCNPDGEVSRNRKLVFKIPVERVGACRKHRIACCGDSITFGLGRTSIGLSYPQVLGQLLGEDYAVGGYGRNGATANDTFAWRPDKHSPWLRSPQAAEALCSAPQTAIVMLGMNDGNPTHVFNAPNGGPMTDAVLQDYVEGLAAVVDKLQALPSRPQVILCQTSAMRRQAGAQWSEAYVRDFNRNLTLIRQAQEQLAARRKLPFIPLTEQLSDPAFYADGVHLTDAGYAALGRLVYDAIRNLV